MLNQVEQQVCQRHDSRRPGYRPGSATGAKLARGLAPMTQYLREKGRATVSAMPNRETRYAELKRYVRWTDTDAAELRAFGAVASPRFRAIAEEFYDRIREHEAAHDVFTGEAQIERLKCSLVRWMDRLCQGPHDEAYFLERANVGRVHVKIGLPQRYMFTAMALIRASLVAIADTMPAERAAAVRHTLARALDIELAIMLETYHEDVIARLHRLEASDRAQLEVALARSEHRYARAMEQGRVVVIGLDAAAHVVLFNSEAERLSGWARDEVLQRPFTETHLLERFRAVEGRRVVRLAAGEAPH